MRFAVDSWSPDYGTSFQDVSDDLGVSDATVNAQVEVAAADWAPVEAVGITPPARVLFVDGVRRIEARLWIHPEDDSGDAAPAVCASYAAGVVESTAGRAMVTVAEPRHGVFTVDPLATNIDSAYGVWEVTHTTAGAGQPLFDALSLALQRKLAELEMICAANARAAGDSSDDLLVIDGPLRGRTALPRTIATIKSHHMAYLPPELNRMVGRLQPGQRTPVFLLGTTWDRFCWYLRLPGDSGSPWAGVLRVECGPDLPADEAIRLAALSQSVLPRYASKSFKEPRAPQNLYPIAGLERELRHRLGDPRLLRRGLQAAAKQTLTSP